MIRPSMQFIVLRAVVGALGLGILATPMLPPVLHTRATADDVSRDGDTLRTTRRLGPVEVTASLTPAEPVIGDEVVLQVEVAAEPLVEVLLPEFGEALEQYTILDFVPRQSINPDGSFSATQTYTLQPMLSGEQSIPPIQVEFIDNRPGQKAAPDDFDAYEILTERIDFTVQSVLPKAASSDLRPPLGELELPSDTQSRWALWVALAAVVAVLAVAAIVLLGKRQRSIRRRNAYEIARTKLDTLMRDYGSADSDAQVEHFFVEISAVIRRYVEHRFAIRAPDLTTDEFLQLAAGHEELTSEHRGLLGEFLQQADAVKFAGVRASGAEVKRSSELASRFLEDTRANAPDVEEPQRD